MSSFHFPSPPEHPLLIDRRFSLPAYFPQDQLSYNEMGYFEGTETSMTELLNAQPMDQDFVRRMSLPFAFPSEQFLDQQETKFEINQFASPPESFSALPAFNALQFETNNSSMQQFSLQESVDQMMMDSPSRRGSFASTSPPAPTVITGHPVLTPRMAAEKLFKKEPEPGLDVVMSTPPSSPMQIQARRASLDSGNKPGRFRPTETEFVMLTTIFQKNPFPSASLRKKLAEKMALDMKQVQFWFQNRRANMKTAGIHVLKPKKGNSGCFNFTKKRMSLSPLSADSSYFFVESGREVDNIQQQGMEDIEAIDA
ncbi:hypothetical protein HDU98_007491 [Podochytrium sp. JEL0797]|nr:hypothetical protein HDU98_007491 [Podochytrium sp. JEL0797]